MARLRGRVAVCRRPVVGGKRLRSRLGAGWHLGGGSFVGGPVAPGLGAWVAVGRQGVSKRLVRGRSGARLGRHGYEPSAFMSIRAVNTSWSDRYCPAEETAAWTRGWLAATPRVNSQSSIHSG